MAEAAKTYSAAVVNLAGVEYTTSQNDATPDIEEKLSTTELQAKTFADFGVSEAICDALGKKGITHPFPIQALTLPVALAGRDIIGQAKTGTGKTLGFGLPTLMKVAGPNTPEYAEIHYAGHPQAMIIVPTRELCKQVAADLHVAARHLSTRITEIYGGAAFDPQIDALNKGTDIVVGTPGRLIDLLKRKILQLHGVNTVVLDEADEMLDLGFLPDIEVLLSRVPQTRQTMLFSATMPGEIVALARRYMKQPTHIRAQEADDSSATVKTVKQVIYRCHSLNKIEVVSRILQARERGLAVIFTRTKRTASNLAEDLTARGFAVASLHGDLGQGAREQAMRAFRNGKVDVLVATDVAARGIDVDDVTHVINYQCPEDEKIYLHRIGRTGRAGASGTAVTFVDWDDVPRWGLISKALNLGVPEPLETYHTSPHLYTDLDIDPAVSGRLPRGKRTREGLAAEAYEDVSGKGRRSAGRSGRSGYRRSGSGRSGSGRSGSGRSVTGRSVSGTSGASRGRSATDSTSTGRKRTRTRRNRTAE